MKTKITTRLVTSAAICGSVFLLAACEPTGSSTDGTTEADSPTYGEQPERDLEISPTEEETGIDEPQEPQGTPGMDDSTQDSQWEEGASQQEPQTPTQ